MLKNDIPVNNPELGGCVVRSEFSNKKANMAGNLSDLRKGAAEFLNDYYLKTEKLHRFLKANPDLTVDQFKVIRDNFLYRTMTTRDMVEKVLRSSERNHDQLGIDLAGLNLYQEDGEGNPDKAHQKLMFEAWDAYEKHVVCPEHNFPKATKDNLGFSNALLREVFLYRDMQDRLYSSKDHVTVVATSYAQESVAEDMLKMFYETMFLANKEKFEAQGANFSEVSEYFSVHLNGTEDDHAKNARTMLEEHCKMPGDAKKALQAIQGFLKVQCDLWESLDIKLRDIHLSQDAKCNYDGPS